MSSEAPPTSIANAPGSSRTRGRWSNRIVLVLFAAVAVPVGATMLYAFPPTEYGFYPPCMLRVVSELVLGYPLHCPGCGATRCVAALLHGDLAQAFAYNPLFVLLLPLISYAAFGTAFQMWTGRRMGGPRMSARMSYVLIAILAAYFIARNIPVEPFNLLAPHEILE